MADNSKFPGVLIILMAKVKADDPGNLLIRSQFGDWPHDSLAQIHATGDAQGHGEFCRRNYCLQECDRLFGRIFQLLRGAVVEMVALDRIEKQVNIHTDGLLWRWARTIKKRFGDWLINSGLWELIFRVRLSKSMVQFVEDFKPDLIYCQGYSLGFATLPLLIGRRCGIPICFQTTDDWPSYTYRGAFMGWLLRRSAQQLVATSSVRVVFGQKMQREYERRYGVQFEATYHLDDPQRFSSVPCIQVQPLRIVYTGSLILRRYEALLDLLDVVRSLQDRIQPLEIVVYCTGLPKDIPQELLNSPEVKFFPLPTHEELPRVLASASILFLPESFNIASEMIEYAISSKSHLYMMSKRPILVYGPRSSGTVGYAIDGGWAEVVAIRNCDLLKQSLWKLLHDCERHVELNRRALECVRNNHDLVAGRERFRKSLLAIVRSAPCSENIEKAMKVS